MTKYNQAEDDHQHGAEPTSISTEELLRKTNRLLMGLIAAIVIVGGTGAYQTYKLGLNPCEKDFAFRNLFDHEGVARQCAFDELTGHSHSY